MTQVNGTQGSAGIALNAPISVVDKGANPSASDPALQKVAQQFEAIFLRQMIGSMRSSSMGEGIFDSSATQQFRDMADARTADEMASKGSMGIADMLLKQFGQKPVTPLTSKNPGIAIGQNTGAAAQAASIAAQGTSLLGSEGDK